MTSCTRLWLSWAGVLLAALSGGCDVRSPAVGVSAAPLTAADSEHGAMRMGVRLPASATGQKAFYEITHSNGFKTHGSIQPDDASQFDAVIDGLPALQGYQLEVNATLLEGCPCGGSAVFNVSARNQTTVMLRLDCPAKHRSRG